MKVLVIVLVMFLIALIHVVVMLPLTRVEFVKVMDQVVYQQLILLLI